MENPTTPTIDIELMVNSAIEKAIPRITEVFKTELNALEERNNQKFISRQEFETLLSRFNAYPQKPANITEVEELRRDLARVEAEKHVYAGQVTALMGKHTELFQSVSTMREHQVEVDKERGNLARAIDLAITSFSQTRDDNREIKAEQVKAREERDELKETVAGTQAWQRDSDARFQTTITRLHDMMHGNEKTGQIGLPKQLETLSKSITEVNEKLDQHREAMKPTVERVESWNKFGEFLVNKVGRAITIRLLFALLGALGLGGAFLAIISQALNGAN